MPKQPTDHKPAADEPFSFHDAEGKKYVLPPIQKGSAKLTGRDLRDAAVNGDAGQLGYMFKALEAAGPKKAALDALYDMPQDDMLEVIKAWGEHTGDGVGLGE